MAAKDSKRNRMTKNFFEGHMDEIQANQNDNCANDGEED